LVKKECSDRLGFLRTAVLKERETAAGGGQRIRTSLCLFALLLFS